MPALVEAVRKGVARLRQDELLVAIHQDAKALVAAFEPVRTPAELHSAVVRRHEATQKAKPPDGARAWLEAGPGEDEVAVRPTFGLADRPGRRPKYVHAYRIETLSNMLLDLRRLS